MNNKEKHTVLSKTKLTERGAIFILSNKELCERIIKEDVIWTEDFIKKYGVSKVRLESYLKKGSLSYFSNHKNQRGCKKYLFEKEAVHFFTTGLYHKGYTTNIEKALNLVLKYSSRYLREKENKTLECVLIKGLSYNDTAKELNTSYQNVMMIIDKAFKKLDMYLTSLKNFDELQDSISNLKYIEETLKKHIDENKGKTKISSDIKLIDIRLIDLDISVRAINSLKAKDIDNLFELTQIKRNHLLWSRNVGQKTLQEIDGVMKKYNISFMDDFENPTK